MAKGLPYFKFIVTEWLTGDIVFEELEIQGLFINICALYWQRNGELSIQDIEKRYKKPTGLQTLCEHILVVNEGMIEIKFLDEQLEEREHISTRNRINGGKNSKPKSNIDAELNPLGSETKPPQSETKPNKNKSKEEKEIKQEEEAERSLTAKGGLIFDCRKYFAQKLPDYVFGQYDNDNIRQITVKLKALTDAKAKSEGVLPQTSNEAIFEAFKALIENAPQWVKERGYELAQIDKNFNSIVNDIRTTANGTKPTKTGKQPIDFSQVLANTMDSLQRK